MKRNKKVMEGFNNTMNIIEEIIQVGYTVSIKRSKGSFDVTDNDKYNTANNIPPELWRHISIKVDSNHTMDALFEYQSKLNNIGISFDTGAGCGMRDWEIDWSFSVK